MSSSTTIKETKYPQEEKKTRKMIFEISKIKNKKIWTEEEDKALIYYSNFYQERHWEEISKHFQNKTALQCFSRFNRIRPGIVKGKWTKEEDEQISKLVEEHGKSWSKIAKLFKTRNGKQIRDRYINVLDPNINKDKFTEEEDKLLTDLYKQNGPKWSEITKHFPNRTTDMIKNRFHSSIKKNFFCQELIKRYRENKYMFLKQKRKNQEALKESENFPKNQTETEDDDITIDLGEIYSNYNCINKEEILSSINCSSSETEHNTNQGTNSNSISNTDYSNYEQKKENLPQNCYSNEFFFSSLSSS